MTLCPAPTLDWSRDMAPASDDFDDIYFSLQGGLEEARAVYLRACGLPERWAVPEFTRRAFVIAELGFGTGLNFLAAWQMWKAHRKEGQRLHFVSVEKFPFAREDLAKALRVWPELADEAAALLAVWPGRVRGTHVLHLADNVTLTLCHDDVEAALAGLSMKADAWFLDGFTPAKNPQMWSENVLARVGELSAGGARIGTFTAAVFVAKGLAKAGFDVRRVEGFGRKRHRLEAHMPPQAPAPAPDVRLKPIIIGAGIAGTSLREAFARRGIAAVVIDAADDSAASGNAAAIVKPRLDRQDGALARFALSAYLYAARHYQNLGAVLSEGVRHAPQTQEQIARFKALADEPALPQNEMLWQDGALLFPKAQVIDPHTARQALMGGDDIIHARAAGYRKNGNEREVLGADGKVIARGTHIIFAAGAGLRDMPLCDDLELRYSRGQISWASNEGIETAFTYGGYAVPLGHDLLLGATHARLTDDNPYTVTAADDAHNFQAYLAATGQAAKAISRPSRTSVRVNSKTTWPFIAQIDDAVLAFTGLGSRGFVFAPLMADMLAADILGEPVAWPDKLRQGETIFARRSG